MVLHTSLGDTMIISNFHSSSHYFCWQYRPEKKLSSRSRRPRKWARSSRLMPTERVFSFPLFDSFLMVNVSNPIKHQRCSNWTIKTKSIACWNNLVDSKGSSFVVGGAILFFHYALYWGEALVEFSYMRFGGTDTKERDLWLLSKVEKQTRKHPCSTGEDCDIDLVDAVGFAATA